LITCNQQGQQQINMAQSKATKKFEKRHLSDTLGRRKDFAKVKQRHQTNAKRKAKKAADNAKEDETPEQDQRPVKKQKQGNDFGEMSVDDFFAGGFQVPEATTQKKAKTQPKSEKKRAREDEDEDDDEEMSDEASMGSVEDEPLVVEGDDTKGEAADDVDTHKDDLKALQKKDPEFYKYLQENDAELLDFAEQAPLDEIDELSGSEEEADGKKSKKKRSTKGEEDDSNEVTKEKVKRWTSQMTENHSLRALREVVLAFRAAAHLNEEDGKNYKYTISNAEGLLNDNPRTL